MATSVAQQTKADKKVALSGLKDSTELSTLLQTYGIPAWDAVVIGDGSGTTRENSCGWAAVLYEYDIAEPRWFHGGFNSGTNNTAELLAVLQPLMDLTSRKRGTKPNGLLTHVFSDSLYVVNGLNADSSLLHASTASANRELWLALHGTRRNGLVIVAHHVPRDTVLWQKQAHDLANEARCSFLKE